MITNHTTMKSLSGVLEGRPLSPGRAYEKFQDATPARISATRILWLRQEYNDLHLSPFGYCWSCIFWSSPVKNLVRSLWLTHRVHPDAYLELDKAGSSGFGLWHGAIGATETLSLETLRASLLKAIGIA
jgi:hypothetical protein